MPFFNWDAKDGEPVVNRRFYIFWAINIPLTLIVLVQLNLWLSFRNRLNRERRMPKKDLQLEREMCAVPVESSV